MDEYSTPGKPGFFMSKSDESVFLIKICLLTTFIDQLFDLYQ